MKTKALRTLRDSHSLKTSEIAELLGVKPQTVRMWLSEGLKDIPTCKLKLLELLLK